MPDDQPKPVDKYIILALIVGTLLLIAGVVLVERSVTVNRVKKILPKTPSPTPTATPFAWGAAPTPICKICYDIRSLPGTNGTTQMVKVGDKIWLIANMWANLGTLTPYPAGGSFDSKTGAVINTAVTLTTQHISASGNGHDGGTVVALPDGGAILVSYGAISATYNHDLPCLNNSTGGPGSGWNCQPFIFGSQIGGGTANKDLTASGSVHAMPTSISELKWGNDPTDPHYAIGCGETQGGTYYLTGSSAVCVVFHQTSTTGGNFLTAQKTDSAVGEQPMTTASTSYKDGNFAIMTPVRSSEYFSFKVTAFTAAVNGTATITAAGCSSGAVSFTAGTTLNTFLTAAASAWQAACNGSTGLTMVNISNTTAYGAGLGLSMDSGSPYSLSAPANPTCTITGSGNAITCAGAVETLGHSIGMDWTGYNEYKSFGGKLWYVAVVSRPSDTYDSSGFQNYGRAFYALQSNGFNPSTGNITWMDITGNYPFDTSPLIREAIGTAERSWPQPLGAGAGGSCTTSACTEPGATGPYAPNVPYLLRPPSSYDASVVPFSYDWKWQGYGTTCNAASNTGDFTIYNNQLRILFVNTCSGGLYRLVEGVWDLATGNNVSYKAINPGAAIPSGPSDGVPPAVTYAPTSAGGLTFVVATTNCAGWPGCSGAGTAVMLYQLHSGVWTSAVVQSYTGTMPCGNTGVGSNTGVTGAYGDNLYTAQVVGADSTKQNGCWRIFNQSVQTIGP
jgi:hypothetical protein